MKGTGHIESIDILRGLAAIGVVCFHFSCSFLPTIKGNYLTPIFQYGYIGVQVFFIISGFIIPYVLYSSNYQLKNYSVFLSRRFMRIAPPAYVVMLMTILVHYLAILYLGREIRGSFPGIDIKTILANFLFVVPFVKDVYYYVDVFWTLTFEFEFYILIGLIFPLLIHKSKVYQVTGMTIIAVIAFSLNNIYYIYFAMGLLNFLFRYDKIGKLEFSAILLLLIAFAFDVVKTAEIIASIFTIILILLNPRAGSVFKFLAKISYSLYIIHLLSGMLLEYIFKNILPIHDSEGGKVFLLLLYVGLTVVVASLFYILVENRFLAYSKKIGKQSSHLSDSTVK